MLFLVLTKSGGKSEIEINEKIREVRQQYEKEFDQNRVLHVDSMLKVVSDEIKDFDSAEALKKHYRGQKKQFEARYSREPNQEWRGEAINFDIKLKMLSNVLEDIDDDSDREPVRSALRNSSNFDEMEHVIDEFSARAPWIQLSDLLETVKRGYDNQIVGQEQNLALLQKKKKRPQTFENEISAIQRHLDAYQSSMNNFVDYVTSAFTGRNASYLKSLQKIEAKYSGQIMSATMSDDAINRNLANFHDEVSSFVDGKKVEIKSLFEDEVRRLGGQFKAEYSITVPTVDISGITAKASEDAYQEKDVPRDPKGFWEWTWKIVSFGTAQFKEEQTVYDTQAYLEELKKTAHLRLYKSTLQKSPNSCQASSTKPCRIIACL